MGALCAKDPAKQADDKWNKALISDKRKDSQVKKLLLLGPGNSGKSTFFKQLLQIHGSGFPEKLVSEAAKAVFDSVILQMKVLITTANEKLHYHLNEDTIEAAAFISELPRDIEINSEIAAKIKIIWADDSMKRAFDERTNLHLVDSAPHFFNDIERIGRDDYMPTETDMLLVRQPTTGVTEQEFSISNRFFKVIDVGGQRSERTKWINCFDSVTAVLFVTSLSCYDQSLYEEDSVNAMHEALKLFEETCNSRWFRKTSMILFLNKSDLFEEKLQRKLLSDCFPEYTGENDFNSALEFVRQQFLERNYHQGKQIYSHAICATNRGIVQKVFDDVQHIVVNASLQRGGLLGPAMHAIVDEEMDEVGAMEAPKRTASKEHVANTSVTTNEIGSDSLL